MTNYRRQRVEGGTYFFTVVVMHRTPRLATADEVRRLCAALRRVKQDLPFETIAMVILPDHLHAVWRLPENDSNYSLRWSRVKSLFSRGCTREDVPSSLARRREKGVWQRRFWEHVIRDEEDLRQILDYVYYNPVKHGLVTRPIDWPYSTFRRAVNSGMYPEDWGNNGQTGVTDEGMMGTAAHLFE